MPYWHDEIGVHFAEVMSESGAFLLGRKTWQIHGGAFEPMAQGDPFGDVMNAMPKYVVSTTLTDADLARNWGESTILRSLDEVAELKETEGGPIIVHGSARLNHALSDAGLIDRYHLLVFPLLLGAGKRLFSSTDKATQKLKLVESETYSNGIQKNVFDVVR
jgi:dihydrofolate reductase